MYTIKRYMKNLKGYAKNLHHPEASIVERYITEEAIEFCSEYIKKVKPVGFLSLNMTKEREVRIQEDYMLSLQVYKNCNKFICIY